jgi:nitrogen regulatory protein PII
MESPKGGAVDRSSKLILAVVRPHLVESLLDGLKLAPIEALTIKEVKGFGRQKNMLDQYSGDEVELSIWVDALRFEEVLEIIESHCKTGRMGDGKIMVIADT